MANGKYEFLKLPKIYLFVINFLPLTNVVDVAVRLTAPPPPPPLPLLNAELNDENDEKPLVWKSPKISSGKLSNWFNRIVLLCGCECRWSRRLTEGAMSTKKWNSLNWCSMEIYGEIITAKEDVFERWFNTEELSEHFVRWSKDEAKVRIVIFVTARSMVSFIVSQ